MVWANGKKNCQYFGSRSRYQKLPGGAYRLMLDGHNSQQRNRRSSSNYNSLPVADNLFNPFSDFEHHKEILGIDEPFGAGENQ